MTTEFGIVEFDPDPAFGEAWTLLVNGVPQSYVDLADPEHLGFAYVRQLSRLLRSFNRVGVPRRVLHLGGGGLTIPRLLEHRWPGSRQLVVERDPLLLALVEERLPFAASIAVEVGDARAVLEGQGPGTYDVIVADVFNGAITPAHVASLGFAQAARRVLAPDGLFLMNVTDEPPLAWTRTQAATLRAAFDDVAILGEARFLGEAGFLRDGTVFRGRRTGNVILPAGNVPMIKPLKHERALQGTEFAEFAGSARPRLDAPA